MARTFGSQLRIGGLEALREQLRQGGREPALQQALQGPGELPCQAQQHTPQRPAVQLRCYPGDWICKTQ